MLASEALPQARLGYMARTRRTGAFCFDPRPGLLGLMNDDGNVVGFRGDVV